MPYSDEQILDTITMAAQTASLLEVAGTPKPGNVHRSRNFWDTRFEHFLAGGVALGLPLRRTARRALQTRATSSPLTDIQVGYGMFDATCSVKEWHRGANTHLGTIFLFAPLAASASLTSCQDVLTWQPPVLASTATHVVKNSSTEDAIWVYRSLEKMGYSRHGQIESMEAPDAFESNAINELKAKNITLHDVMKTSSRWDRIASEMVSGYPISLNIGVPAFHYAWERFHDVNMTTVHIFLQILSEFPDLMIARKVGLQYTTNVEEAVQIGRPMSESVSLDAKLAIEAGGLSTREGIHLIRELDARLRQRGNLLNPGSTADVTAATLMLMLLSGWRP